MRFLSAALLGLSLALAGFLPAGAAAAAVRPGPIAERVVPASANSCVSAGNVWVIVITGDGGVIAQGCSVTPTSGREALTSVTDVIEREQGFVCQINSVPNRCAASSEWTTSTPMWRYSYATPGGSWIYSNYGYAARTPARGSLEGWCLSPGPCEATLARVLNPGSVPGYVPAPTKPATTAAPTTTAARTQAPTATAPATKGATKAPKQATTAATTAAGRPSASTSAPVSTAPVSTAPVSTTPASTAPVSTGSTPDPSGSASVTTTVSPSAEASPTSVVATPPAGGNGTPWGVITTAGVIVAAASAFGVVRIRRGKASVEPTES